MTTAIAPLHPPQPFHAKERTASQRGVPDASRAESAVRALLEALGENADRPGLDRTPERVARALSFLTSGRDRSPREVVGQGIFEGDYSAQVLVRDIEFYSLCEHHVLPFRGSVHIAYLPDGRIAGLSKLPRIVDLYARRLQVQERLTEQVASALEGILAPRGVAVVVEAEHFCMLMRGVEKQASRTVSTVFRGAYEEDAALRAELMMLLAVRSPVAAPGAGT